jgi:hypothetical protein
LIQVLCSVLSAANSWLLNAVRLPTLFLLPRHRPLHLPPTLFPQRQRPTISVLIAEPSWRLETPFVQIADSQRQAVRRQASLHRQSLPRKQLQHQKQRRQRPWSLSRRHLL